MKKKLLLIISIVLIIFTSIFIIFLNKDKKGYYSIKRDNIKSITSIVGDRILKNKSTQKNNGTIIKKYEYDNVKDPYTDLSLYISYLKDNSNFVITKNYDLNNKNGKIQLSRYSNKKNYIIIMDISYTKDTYIIKITRGKGKIKTSK